MNEFFTHGTNRLLGSLLLLTAIIALASYANLAYTEARYQFSGPSTIQVTGEGEVVAKPDLGVFTFTVLAEADTAPAAQEQSATALNEIIAYLQAENIAEADIKNQNYNLNPTYRYEERVCAVGSYCPPGERVIDGYEARQSVEVKVRETDRAGALISGVGERGATNISGLRFTIDNPDAFQADARAAAIADAHAKAKRLAADLGVSIKRIVNFNEHGGGYYPMAAMEARGGEMMDMAESAVSPQVPTGENTISSTVNIVFEIR